MIIACRSATIDDTAGTRQKQDEETQRQIQAQQTEIHRQQRQLNRLKAQRAR
jgi:hypothetical protein